ncbi:proteasome maturation protein [Dermacentor variabilis]|uniref:proteasome maturation protein n=1 Tax=Dermacentor variabilis TaxID=34621 RepID=UPI003F5B4BD8
MNLPPLRPTNSQKKPASGEHGDYGVHDVMLHGFPSVRNSLASSHPLEESEKSFEENARKMQMATARSIQGLHAPLKLMVERKAALQIGRLPFLPSSNTMLEVLDGRDETITFEDLYNEFSESEVLRPPQLVMEKHLNLL